MTGLLAVPAFAFEGFEDFPVAAPEAWYPHRAETNLGQVRGGELRALRERFGITGDSKAARAALSAQVRLLNDQVLRALPTSGGGSLTSTEIREVLKAMVAHPIVGPAGYAKYDPDHRVGFCFGRAAFAHLELLARGARAQEVAKIFALGSLRHRGGPWRFHVATVVKDDQGRWWAVDSLQKDILEVGAWIRAVNAMDIDPKAPTVRYYVTDPAKFQPLLGAYEAKMLQDPLFNGYFVDLAGALRDARELPKVGARAGVRRLSDMESK